MECEVPVTVAVRVALGPPPPLLLYLLYCTKVQILTLRRHTHTHTHTHTHKHKHKHPHYVYIGWALLSPKIAKIEVSMELEMDVPGRLPVITYLGEEQVQQRFIDVSPTSKSTYILP